MVQIEKYELNVNASKKNRKRVHKLQDSSKHTTTQVNSKNDDLNGEVHVIDKKYDEINGKGYFDWFVALPVGFGYCISLSYILPFLTQIPTILCSQDGMNWNKCSTSDICNVESSPMYKLDELSSYTITNWITDRGLLCISNFDRALFGSI